MVLDGVLRDVVVDLAVFTRAVLLGAVAIMVWLQNKRVVNVNGDKLDQKDICRLM